MHATAVKALIVAVALLEAELEKLRAAVSPAMREACRLIKRIGTPQGPSEPKKKNGRG
jgi:outer membrane murein-binding lipoprotein Lpp